MRGKPIPAWIAWAFLVVVIPLATNASIASGFEHAGLLGKRYVDFKFGLTDYLDSPHASNGTRFQLEFNSPVWKQPEWGIDFYADFQTGRESAQLVNHYTNGSVLANWDFDLSGAAIGTTFYLDGNWIRPFVQLGLSYTHVEMNAEAFFTSGGYSTSRGFLFIPGAGRRESEDDFRTDLNVGYEIDVLDNIAWRSSLAVDTEGSFGNSFLSTELIIRPLDRGFLRVGIGTDLDTDYITGMFGVGFEF